MEMMSRNWFSEYICQFEYDNYLAKTSRSRYHGDAINLRIWMVQEANCEPSQAFCCCLARSGDPVRKWIGKGGFGMERRDMLRSVGKRVMFLILLL